MISPKRQRGFNLLETLVASMILSGTVVTVGALSTRMLQGIGQHAAYEAAAQLADRQLRLIDYMGVDRFIEQGQTEGFFEQPAPGYRWQVSAEALNVGYLYSVTITMTWQDRGRPRSLSLATRLNGAGTLSLTDGEEQSSR